MFSPAGYFFLFRMNFKEFIRSNFFIFPLNGFCTIVRVRFAFIFFQNYEFCISANHRLLNVFWLAAKRISRFLKYVVRRNNIGFILK